VLTFSNSNMGVVMVENSSAYNKDPKVNLSKCVFLFLYTCVKVK